MKRNTLIATTFILVLAALGITRFMLQDAAEAQGDTVRAPFFEVDPFWPKPLPNHWILGSAIGAWVDERDHVWIIHRSSATLANQERGLELENAECCAGAPPVLEFDPEGNLVGSWGGPGEGYEWPQSNHGIFVDHLGNVWIGGNGGGDSHILKFTRSGRNSLPSTGWLARTVVLVMRGQTTTSLRSRAIAPTCRTSAVSRRSSWIRPTTRPMLPTGI